MNFSNPIRRTIEIFLGLTAISGSAYAVGFPATNEDLRGLIATKCSGLLVRIGRNADQRAVVLTGGRCATSAPIEAGDAVVNSNYDRGLVPVFFGTETPESLSASRILYATQTGTDLALVELKSTYRELELKGAKIYEISEVDARPDMDVQLVSGLWKEKQLCGISHSVPALIEGTSTTTDAYAFKDTCTIEKTGIGIPLFDPLTMRIVGILGSTNRSGAECTLDNPCEEIAGKREAFKGRSYGQRVSPILECLNEAGEIDLGRSMCKLTKPKVRGPSPRATPTPGSSGKPTSHWPKKSGG